MRSSACLAVAVSSGGADFGDGDGDGDGDVVVVVQEGVEPGGSRWRRGRACGGRPRWKRQRERPALKV
jgi:hypothetical protein